MASVEQKRRVLQRKIRRLRDCQRRLVRHEKKRRMWMHRLRYYKVKEIRRQQAVEHRKKVLSRRETAKLNRTLRRRRRR